MNVFCDQCFTYDQSAVHLCPLHAAAPDLLAALKTISNWDDPVMMRIHARAAIAAVRGEILDQDGAK